LRRSQIVADYEELKSVCKNFSASFIRINATSDSIELKTSTPFELLNPVFMLMVMPNFLEAQIRSKISRTMADERALATALESYYIDYNQYPNILHQLTSPVAYITSVPIDLYVPQAEGEGMYVKYVPAEDRKDWLIYSYGPDETDNKGQTLYDPTNGTISGGDIVRTKQ
jgi:type II secretory pathway pseudopilin PulG